MLISQDGKVPTAGHVVHTADEISVEFLDGTVARASVIASEPEADVALLQLDHVPERASSQRLATRTRSKSETRYIARCQKDSFCTIIAELPSATLRGFLTDRSHRGNRTDSVEDRGSRFKRYTTLRGTKLIEVSECL